LKAVMLTASSAVRWKARVYATCGYAALQLCEYVA